jgi:hypothetical protein
MMSTRCRAVLLSSAIGLALTGCTLIGFGIGAVADASKKPIVVSGEQVAAIENGASVRIELKDGRRIRGKYLGLVPAEGSGPEGPTAILVDTGSGSAPPIPVAEVAEVRVSRKAHGKWIGAGVGAALDIGAVIFLYTFEYP